MNKRLQEKVQGLSSYDPITSFSLWIHCAVDDVFSISITFFIVCSSHLTFKSVLFGHSPESVYGSIPLGKTTLREKIRENMPLTYGLSDGHETHPTAIEC